MGRIPAAGALAAALAGCFFEGGEPSRVVEAERRSSTAALPPAPDRHPYGDPAALKVGQWATYREGTRELTIAVVGEEDGALWIEVIEEGEPRLASARLTARTGEVKRAWAGEAGGAATRQGLSQASPPPTPPSGEAEEASVRAGGRELKVRRVTRRTEDLEGRVQEERWDWSAEVPPLYAGSAHGGLVRREGKGHVVELLRFGSDARPCLARPR
jgi:hypothetical protein